MIINIIVLSINYDVWLEGRVSITEEQRWYEPIKTQLGIPNHTTCGGPRPTYINLHLDFSKREPVCASREYSTPPPCATPDRFTRWVHASLAISHSQCVVVFSHNGIAKVLGLSEYVVSTTKSQPHTSLQRTILNWHKRSTTLRLHSRCKPPARS
jgi:hypothetical protein